MKRLFLLGTAASLLLAVAACNKPSPDPRADTTAPTAPVAATASPSPTSDSAPIEGTASPSPNTASPTPKEPAAPPRELHPPAGTASREARERAVVELLSGRAHASELPLADVAPGEEFEPRLRWAMGAPMDIRVGKVTTDGLDEQEIKKAVERQVMRLRVCYAGGLRINPNLQGRIMGRVTVDAAGAPLTVENAMSDMPDGSVVACALKALQKMAFPAPKAPRGTATVDMMFLPA